jgi:hypothetical protein
MYIGFVKTGSRGLAWVGAAAALLLAARAEATAVEVSAKPYEQIASRNVFGLVPIPPAPRPEDNKPPPAKITLAGITTFAGGPRALLKVTSPPRPGVKPEEQSLILAVGQREGEIEVLEIDQQAGTVKVENFGTITTVDFENNGVKLPSGPFPGVPIPGAPHVAAAGMPPQPGVPMAATLPEGSQIERKVAAARAARFARAAGGYTTVPQ